MKETIIKASEIIFGNEGDYTSINADDNGAVSIGRIQWHGTRALNLLKRIIAVLGVSSATEYLEEELYVEINTSRSWAKRTVNTLEAAKLSALLSTEESKQVQDEQSYDDVESYISHIKKLGVDEENAQIFMADIENQGGSPASTRIIDASQGKDLNSLYLAAKADSVFSKRMERRDRVYKKLTGHAYGEEAYDGIVHEVQYGENLSQISRKYGTTVSEITELNNISNPDFIRAGDNLKIPKPQVSEDNKPKTPSAITHKVVRGDTFIKISSVYGVSIASIIAANRSKYRAISRDYIVEGWKLIIPSGDGT